MKDTTKKQIIELLMAANGIKKEKFDKEYKILFITEGHSASSVVRQTRDARAHGVLALRGKIMNTYSKTLSDAMKSDIIKEFLTVMKEEDYDAVVILTDADPDGAHITSLVMTCAMKFMNSSIKDGKFLICDTPFYTFLDKKNHQMKSWGNDMNDCPPDCYIDVNKGLGSYTPSQFTRLALYPQLGAEYEQICYDRNTKNPEVFDNSTVTNKALYNAMRVGHVDWVIDETA